MPSSLQLSTRPVAWQLLRVFHLSSSSHIIHMLQLLLLKEKVSGRRGQKKGFVRGSPHLSPNPGENKLFPPFFVCFLWKLPNRQTWCGNLFGGMGRNFDCVVMLLMAHRGTIFSRGKTSVSITDCLPSSSCWCLPLFLFRLWASLEQWRIFSVLLLCQQLSELFWGGAGYTHLSSL